MKYNELTCFWCGKTIGEGNKAFCSLGTDTLQTMRNFCTEEHLLLFKKYMLEQKEKNKPVKPYMGSGQ